MAKKDLFENLEVTEDTHFIMPGTSSFRGADEPEDGGHMEDADPEAEAETDEEEPEVEIPEYEDDAADEGEEFSYEPLFQDLVAEGILSDTPEDHEGFDDSPEGFREAIKYSRDQEIGKYIDSLPATAQRIMQLAIQGGEEEDIQALLTLEDGPDWEAADLDDEDVQRAAVEEAMRLRDADITDEEIQEALDDLSDLGKLQKTAEKDRKFLLKQQQVQKDEVEQLVAKRQQETQARYQQEVESVKSYVDTVPEIAGYKLKKTDREGFIKYLTEKDKNGQTAADRNNTAERRIQKEFLNYKNFNVATVERQATTDITKEIRKQLARYPRQGAASQPVRIEKQEDMIGRILLPGRGN